MSFDIDSVIKDMANSIQSSIGEGVADIASFATKALEAQKESLAELIEARQCGDITEQELQQELEREMMIVETELLTIKVIGKAAIKKAINAAIGVLIKLVKPI